jgi:hypothetical protein
MGRKRRPVDIDSLSEDEIKSLYSLLGEQIRSICDKSVLSANKILNKYGIECKMAFHIGKLGSFPAKESNLINKESLNK